MPNAPKRELKYFQAIHEALDLCLEKDPSVYVMGLGVPDPKGVFGTTAGLQKKFGDRRVMDMPTSENAMTGVAIGAALTGMRPVLVHQRIDFALLAMDQMVSQAAKWHYMFGGKMKVPIVIRMLVGRGWGQGPQHSQSLQAWFAHIPGLKVVMPATPYDAKGMLVTSIEDNNPVIFIEHRWLHNTFGEVPEGIYRVPLAEAKIARTGKDLTLAATSYAVLEALRAAEALSKAGVEAEVIDLRSLRPLDLPTIFHSVRKTGRLLVADTGWKFGGFGAEVVASVTEELFRNLKCAPRRLGMLDAPVPTSPALSYLCYPGVPEILTQVFEMMKIPREKLPPIENVPLFESDIPDPQFAGPF